MDLEHLTKTLLNLIAGNYREGDYHYYRDYAIELLRYDTDEDATDEERVEEALELTAQYLTEYSASILNSAYEAIKMEAGLVAIDLCYTDYTYADLEKASKNAVEYFREDLEMAAKDYLD